LPLPKKRRDLKVLSAIWSMDKKVERFYLGYGKNFYISRMNAISKNEALGPFLNDEDALAIAQQHASGVIRLAALDCKWTEYFNLWAAVSFYEKEDKVFLHGARFSNWNLGYEMELVGTEKNLGLYRISLTNPEQFPNEFVIRLERENGEHFYDNNDYRNYYIDHSKGHFTTAISNKGSILSFDSITPIKIICSTP